MIERDVALSPFSPRLASMTKAGGLTDPDGTAISMLAVFGAVNHGTKPLYVEVVAMRWLKLGLVKRIKQKKYELLSLFFIADINECTTNSHNCNVNAACQNIKGSFQCTCNRGYGGDGRQCSSKYQIWLVISTGDVFLVSICTR